MYLKSSPNLEHDTLNQRPLNPMRTAYIALGSNLTSPAGSPEVTLVSAARNLQSLGVLRSRSSLYSTEPVGFADQPQFLNAVVAVDSELGPQALLDDLLVIEKGYGRDRSAGIPNGPRSLDLDILLLGNLQVSEPGLQIPHPRLAERAFVLIPLNEIAPEIIVPGHQRTVAQLLQTLLEKNKGKSHAVVQVQSDVWRARGNSGDPDGALRAAATRKPDHHGRG
jgi:2-amino-4-hydroxy-6-hydroxymethyldihydropteridine diphosphokinase